MATNIYINQLVPNTAAQLLIEIGTKQLSYVALQDQQIKAFAVHQLEHKESLTALLNSEDLLQFSFNKVDIVFAIAEATLIPAAVHKIGEAVHYLNLLFGAMPNSTVQTALNFNHQIHVLYATPKDQLDTLQAHFGALNMHHQYSCFLEQKDRPTDSIQIVVYAASFTIIVVKDNKVQIMNQYAYNNAEDVAYMLLKAAKQYELSTEQVELTVHGLVEKQSAFYDTLHQYFGKLEFGHSNNAAFEVDTALQNYPEHYYAYLINYLKCV